MIDNTALIRLKDTIILALDGFVAGVESIMIVESPDRHVIVEYTIKVDAPMNVDDVAESVNLYKELAAAAGLYVDFVHDLNGHDLNGWITIALPGDFSSFELSPWHS